MQLQKANAVACSKPPALKTYSGSVWYLINANAQYLWYKGACHDSQTDPLDRIYPYTY